MNLSGVILRVSLSDWLRGFFFGVVFGFAVGATVVGVFA